MQKHRPIIQTSYARKQKARHLRRALVSFLFLFTVISLTYLFAFSGLFKIKKIEIIGNKKVSTNDVLFKVNSLIEKQNSKFFAKNLVFVNLRGLNTLSLADVDSLSVSKNFFSQTIKIYVNEKRPFLVLISDHSKENILDPSINTWYLDENGKAFQSNQSNLSKLPTLDLGNFEFKQNQQIWNQKQINIFKKLVTHLNSENHPLNTLIFSYSFSIPSAITYVSSSFDILLTLNDDIVKALNIADEFAKKENNPKVVISKYIDVRYYPEKLYYK